MTGLTASKTKRVVINVGGRGFYTSLYIHARIKCYICEAIPEGSASWGEDWRLNLRDRPLTKDRKLALLGSLILPFVPHLAVDLA